MSLTSYFFDNEQSNIDAFRGCNLVKAYKISGTDPWINPSVMDPQQIAYKTRLSSRARAQARVLDSALGASLWDSASGLEPEQWTQFFRGFQAGAPSARIRVILDWDRTLTQTEGIIPGSNDGFESMKLKSGLTDFTMQDLMEFNCGGLRRLFGLIQFLDYLQSKQAVVAILTNNPTCYNKPQLMRDMMSYLTQNRPQELLCSRKFLNKKVALESYIGSCSM